MNLIQYIASYGDLLPPAEPEAKHSSTTQRNKVSSDTTHDLILQLQYNNKALPIIHIQFECIFGQAEFPSRPTSQTSLLAETEQQMLQDLMSEAMEETDGQHASGLQQNGKRFGSVSVTFLAP